MTGNVALPGTVSVASSDTSLRSAVMTDSPSPEAPLPLHVRLEQLERAAASRSVAGYGRLYAPLAILILAMAFLPLFDSRTEEKIFWPVWEYGTPQAAASYIAVALMTVLLVLLITAIFRPQTVGIPIGIAVLCLVLLWMLISKPGLSSKAEFTEAGQIAMVILPLGSVLAFIHDTHLRRLRSKYIV